MNKFKTATLKATFMQLKFLENLYVFKAMAPSAGQTSKDFTQFTETEECDSKRDWTRG